MKVAFWSLTGLLLASSLQVFAADATAVYTKGGGNPAAMACITCHGAEGEGMAAAGFPRLAGLSADYMQKQLGDYLSGDRANPIMQPIAAALTPEEVEAVTTMLASKPAPEVKKSDAQLRPKPLAQSWHCAARGSAIFLNAWPVMVRAGSGSARPFRHSRGNQLSTCPRS